MNAIVDFFVQIYDWVVSLFSDCLQWFLDLLYSFIEPLIAPLVDAVPDLSVAWSYFQPFAPYTAFLNKWIALDYGITLLTAYFTFILIMISVKLIVKLFIPTVG